MHTPTLAPHVSMGHEHDAGVCATSTWKLAEQFFISDSSSVSVSASTRGSSPRRLLSALTASFAPSDS